MQEWRAIQTMFNMFRWKQLKVTKNAISQIRSSGIPWTCYICQHGHPLKTPLKTNVSIQHPIQQHLSRLWWVMGTLASILPETDSLHWKMDGFCIYWVLSFWGPVSQPICLSFLGPGFSLGPSSPSHKASGFPSELDTPYLADGKTRRFSYRFLSVTQLGANPYGIRAAGISYLHMVDVLM